ncbi:hypothetical protein PISL3812_00241 [Talaromyces islandicus]|uniref:Uncharacterized protein n=1 Tax=Talaromyces islandicus TaxID=28573 RepID=A0A0U1LIR7_TALIS|nr:hypothetical protein PISL3812_00241 [Talaromyces islandicus]
MEDESILSDESFVLPDNPDAPLCVGSSLRWAFDNGAVDDQGEVLRSCDDRFLIEILVRLERGYDNIFQQRFVNALEQFVDENPQSENSSISEELNLVSEKRGLSLSILHTSDLFVEIAREVRRLQRYQKLFPTQQSMELFLSSLESKLILNHDRWTRIARKIETEAYWTKLEKAEYLIELWITTPTYQYDLKPWQQFLNDGAPGSGLNPKAKFLGKVPESDDFDFTKVTADSNFQIVPPGGMVIWTNWFNHVYELEQKIKRTIVPERFKCKHRMNTRFGAQMKMKRLPPMLYRRETITFDFGPNMWKPKGSSDQKLFPPDSLPEFNALIEQLEGIQGAMLDEDITNGILIASEKNDHHSVLHHLF